MREREIITAVATWFRNKYGPGDFCDECTTDKGRRADLVYVQRADVIHVVEAKSDAASYKTGLDQLDRYPANYRWLALPKDSYEAFESGIASTCSSRGYGLLLVSGKDRKRVEVRRRPDYFGKRFDHRWPKIFNP